jgi:hypothetical protein
MEGKCLASQVALLDGSGMLRVHFKQQTPPVPQVTLLRALVALAVSLLGEYYVLHTRSALEVMASGDASFTK